MSIKSIVCGGILVSALCLSGYAADELSTSPADPAELEALYTAAVERRAANILDALDLKDSSKASEVHTIIVNQYRALRSRDAVINAYLKATGPTGSEASAEQQALFKKMTEPLHRMYVKTLSAYLTPEQVEVVKDEMTYNVVRVTFDAYCLIIPDLTEDEEAMILDKLKLAREEAMDGGSAREKHDIFDRYKKQINAQLTANGHDVQKAFDEYEAKQDLAGSAATSNGRSN